MSAPAPLIGSQVPTFEWVPGGFSVSSGGQEAVGLALQSGKHLDAWQDRILHGSLNETPQGLWLSNEVLVILSRQQGKGDTIEARELGGLFCFGERRILHSAHEQKTSNEAFQRMLVTVQSNPDLDQKVIAVSRSKGEEGITFRMDKNRPGDLSRIRYVSRTGGVARGFAGTDLVVLDESMILDDPPIAAMLPTMATRPNWQVWYTGSAGDRRLRTESVVMARVRRRALRREAGLAAFLWEAHLKHTDQCPRDLDTGAFTDPLDVRTDPRTHAKVMPAYNVRVSPTFIEKMLRGMAPWDFDREFLGVGDYPSDEGWHVLGEEQWSALLDPASRRFGRPVFAIEPDWDRRATAVVMAAYREDRRVHVEVIKYAPGTAWVVDYCRALKPWRPLRFVIDPKGPADVLAADLVNAKLRVHQCTLPEYQAWSAKMYLMCTETFDVRHIGQPTLDTAAQHVERRDTGGGRYVWKRDDADASVAPFIGATLAAGWLASQKRRGPMVASAG